MKVESNRKLERKIFLLAIHINIFIMYRDDGMHLDGFEFIFALQYICYKNYI